jgi:Cytochrome C'
MKSKRFDWRSAGKIAVYIGATAGLLAGCNANVEKPPAAAPASTSKPAEPAFTPAVSINALMVTWIDNASHVLWDVEKKEFAPKNEADWIELEDHATQLAAAGSLIQMGGTGQADAGWVQQIGWKTNAQALTAAALADLSAAKSRNLGAVIKANGDLVASCEGCHKEFKPALPSEGITHQRPHSESLNDKR